MGGHSNYQPKSAFGKWLHERLPIMELVQGAGARFPDAEEPQLLVDLRRHPGRHAGGADRHRHRAGHALHAACRHGVQFGRADHARRELRLAHPLHAPNGASMFFLAVYIHIFRGMYYGSYKAPREVLWMIGVLIYLVMMATAFMGYVLPWGQMSFWGAKVITNLFSAIPVLRRADHHLAVGRLCGRQSDAQPLLLAALPLALRAGGPGRPAYLGAARAGQQQPDRRRRQVGPGHGAFPSLLHDEGCLRDRGVPDPVRGVHVLRAELSGPRRSTTSRPIRW